MAEKGLKIKELPEGQRPRERLFRLGVDALTDVELLAILLGTGNAGKRESVLDLAARVLMMLDAGTEDAAVLRNLAQVAPQELCRIEGVGPAKASRILAAVELGKRMAAERPRRLVVKGPEDVAGMLIRRMRYLDREHFQVVLLNTKNRVLGVQTVSVGGLDTSLVHPREVFKPCVKRSAASVILAHNHPSGDPTPSGEDIAVTRRMVKAGDLLGIDVLDHLVIGDRRYVSIRRQVVNWDDDAQSS